MEATITDLPVVATVNGLNRQKRGGENISVHLSMPIFDIFVLKDTKDMVWFFSAM